MDNNNRLARDTTHTTNTNTNTNISISISINMSRTDMHNKVHRIHK